MQILVFVPFWGARVHTCYHVSIFTPPLFFTSLRTCTGRTVWPIFVFYPQKTCFDIIYVLFGIGTIFFIFSTIFFAVKRDTLYSRNVKLWSAIASEPWNLHVAGSFRPCRNERCDLHLCHVTESDHAYKTAKINFIKSGPVGIIRTAYYIHGPELIKLIFAVLYVSRTMDLARFYKTDFFYIYTV